MARRQYKTGVDRQQVMLLPPSLDEYVSETNAVRAIDAYVESLDLAGLGFQHASGGCTAGQPPYHPGRLLKLYLWGYLNRIRSSRRLELETYRNLEVIWLIQQLHPTYKTIADFRKENSRALKEVYKDFLQVCRELELFGGELVGIDSAFLEGDASRASIYTEKRLTTLLERLEKDVTAYLDALDQHDAQDAEASHEDELLREKLAVLQARQRECQGLLDTLETSEQTQVSCTDEDARLLSKKTDKGPTAGYNVQCAVDDKHKLIVACDVVSDGNDQHQLVPLATQAKEHLEVEHLAAAADAGYYTQEGIKDCLEAGITPYVAIPDKNSAIRQQGRFTRDEFRYDAETDTYQCPGEKSLVFWGTTQKKGKTMRRYGSRSAECKGCPLKGRCLPEKTPYRQISRWKHEAVVEEHQQRMDDEGGTYMRKRAGLAEHPFGTLKLWCGWTHFLVRGLKKVRGEWSLLVTCYNFKRVLNLIGVEAFRTYCEQRARSVWPVPVAQN
jgi:transposase